MVQKPSPEDGAAAMCMLEPMPERNLYVAKCCKLNAYGKYWTHPTDSNSMFFPAPEH